MFPITKPGEGAAGKTGTWRWKKPIISYDKCTKCGLCWLYCPEPAFYLDDEGYPHINYDWCKGCGICFHECPVKAIEMVNEYE
jgi:pyruvate ferredoxin oxidoreductase delta subunit